MELISAVDPPPNYPPPTPGQPIKPPHPADPPPNTPVPPSPPPIELPDDQPAPTPEL